MQNGSPEQKNGVSFRFPGVFCVYYSLRNIKSSSSLCLSQSKGAKFFDLSAARFFLRQGVGRGENPVCFLSVGIGQGDGRKSVSP